MLAISDSDSSVSYAADFLLLAWKPRGPSLSAIQGLSFLYLRSLIEIPEFDCPSCLWVSLRSVDFRGPCGLLPPPGDLV